jgi:hypothetical protein
MTDLHELRRTRLADDLSYRSDDLTKTFPEPFLTTLSHPIVHSQLSIVGKWVGTEVDDKHLVFAYYGFGEVPIQVFDAWAVTKEQDTRQFCNDHIYRFIGKRVVSRVVKITQSNDAQESTAVLEHQLRPLHNSLNE